MYKKIDNLIVFDNGIVYREQKLLCKLIEPKPDKHGYLRLYVNKELKYVHRLIMEAFNGYSDLTVDHIDGNKRNNSLENLEYVTQKENVLRLHDKRVLWNGKEFRNFRDLARFVEVDKSVPSAIYHKGYKLKGYKIEIKN